MSKRELLQAPCEPCCNWCIDVGDGHWVWVEECGQADGIPVLFLHGGPGSGCSTAQRRLFESTPYRVIMVDQRGAGRSRPLGGLRANTTEHLVADLELIRQRLGIPRWLLFGGSWGSLLALRYAQQYPEAVNGLVLRGIFLGSREEIDAYLAKASVPALCKLSDGDLLAACADAVLHGSPTRARRATRAWLNHERFLMGERTLSGIPTPEQEAKVRIQMHYLPAGCFVDRDALLAGIDRIRHLPAAIVQGLADPVCPPHTAASLHARWPEARWVGLEGEGHNGMSPAIASACMQALDEVAGRAG